VLPRRKFERDPPPDHPQHAVRARRGDAARRSRCRPARAAAASGAACRRSKSWKWCKRVAASCKVRHHRRRLPGWITESDLDFYGAEFKTHRLPRRSQLLSQPRSQLGDPELTCRCTGHYSCRCMSRGDRDFVVSFPGTDQLLANLKNFVPNLRGNTNASRLRVTGPNRSARTRVSTAIIDFVRRPAGLTGPAKPAQSIYLNKAGK